MKHCTNCRWCCAFGDKPEFWRCLHPDIAVMVESPVDGVKREEMKYCAVERGFTANQCGPDGKLFKKK